MQHALRILLLQLSFAYAINPISALSRPDPTCFSVTSDDVPDFCGSLRSPDQDLNEARQLAADIHDADSAEVFIHYMLMSWTPPHRLPLVVEIDPDLDGAGASWWVPATTPDGQRVWLRHPVPSDAIWSDLYWGWQVMLSLSVHQYRLIQEHATDTYADWERISGGFLCPPVPPQDLVGCGPAAAG